MTRKQRLSIADAVFLDRLAIAVSCDPCQLDRADLLRLLQLAGYDPATHVYQEVQGQPGGSVLVLRDGAMALIAAARGGGV